MPPTSGVLCEVGDFVSWVTLLGYRDRDPQPQPLWTLECLFRGNVGIHRAPKAIQVDGSRPRRVSLPGFPRSSLSGTLASYGASAVARTSGRGHVAEA